MKNLFILFLEMVLIVLMHCMRPQIDNVSSRLHATVVKISQEHRQIKRRKNYIEDLRKSLRSRNILSSIK